MLCIGGKSYNPYHVMVTTYDGQKATDEEI